MIKRCPVCGIESETAASFCTECGTKLVAVEEIIEEEAHQLKQKLLRKLLLLMKMMNTAGRQQHQRLQ